MIITIVDDEQNILQTMARILSNMGHTVRQFTSAEQALADLPLHGSQLVLTDVRMPGMSGFDLLHGIQSHPKLTEVDVVLFTGFGEISDAVRAIREGACDYLEKPVSMSDLIKLVNRIAESRRSGRRPSPEARTLETIARMENDSPSECFPLDEAVLLTVRKCLARCRGNKSKAARYLGIPRNRLYNYLRKLEQLDQS